MATGTKKILSLFSGIGGLDLGLTRSVKGADVAAVAEKDPFARAVLARRFPEAVIYEDVVKVARMAKAGTLGFVPDIVIGGFPCQDVSQANRSACGIDGARSGLVHAMMDIVEATAPEFVVYENVPALRGRGLQAMISNHHRLGYELTWDAVTAYAVGAPHMRNRIFVIAHRPTSPVAFQSPDTSGFWKGTDLGDVPPMRLAAGVKIEREHYKDQLRTLGNAVVPQVGAQVGKALISAAPGAKARPLPRGAKPLAKLTQGRGFEWLMGSGSLPRAGTVHGDTVYSLPSKVKHGKTPVLRATSGQIVWVRNPTGDRIIYSGFDADIRLALDAIGNGRQVDDERLLEEMEAMGLVALSEGKYRLTLWGRSAAEQSGHWTYQGEGGANDGNPGAVFGVNGDMIDVMLSNGDIEPFDHEYINLYPTPGASDWKGGFEDIDADFTDPLVPRRKKGAQLRHWVGGTGFLNPRFAEWLMGFEAGWVDIGANGQHSTADLLEVMAQMQTIRERIASAIKAGKAQSGINIYQGGIKALQRRVKDIKRQAR